MACELWICRGFGWLPFAVVILVATTFVTTYIIAIATKHVPVFFPYISDTGAIPPESCVFGQLVNLCALIAAFTIYVRYKHVVALTGDSKLVLRRLNLVALFVGLSSCFGMSLVANFQETNVEAVHLVGAGILFVCGTIYELMHVILSFGMCPTYNGKLICWVRLVIWVISFIAMVTTFTTGAVASSRSHSEGHFKWKSGDPGYAAHITSTLSEWVMAFTFVAFFLTYIRDFQKVSFKVSAHLYAMHLDDDPIYPDENARLIL